MKKFIIPIVLTVFAVATLVFVGAEAVEELRPSQKIMRARSTLLGLLNKKLAAKRFQMISKNANELAMETKKTSKNLDNPEAKEITLAISSLAEDVYRASLTSDESTIKTKLGEIKGKCQECHIKFRK